MASEYLTQEEHQNARNLAAGPPSVAKLVETLPINQRPQLYYKIKMIPVLQLSFEFSSNIQEFDKWQMADLELETVRLSYSFHNTCSQTRLAQVAHVLSH